MIRGGSLLNADGGYLNYLDMGDQQATDENGQPKGLFSSYMFAFGLNYGVRVSRNVGVGLGVKYFRDKLSDDSVIQDPQGGGSGRGPGSGQGYGSSAPNSPARAGDHSYTIR